MVAALEATGRDDFVQSQWNAAGGGVAVAVEVDDEFLALDSENVSRRVENAAVGLMKNDQRQIAGGQASRVNYGANRISQQSNGPLKDRAAVHLNELAASGEGFGRQWLARAAAAN